MKIFGTVLLLASASWLNLPAAEATNSVVVSSELVNRLLEQGLTNNPALRAAGSRVRAADANLGSVRTWEDPTALFGGSVYSDKGFKPEEDGNLAYGIEQKLPLWGRPKLNRGVAEAGLSMRRAEADLRVQQFRRDLMRELLLAWLEATAKTTENRYRAGQAVVADTLQVQNEVARRNDMLQTDRRRLGHEHLTLNRLLNRGVASPWPPLQLPDVAPNVPFSQKLLTLALGSEPRLRVMEQEIKQAEAAAQLARNLRLPDLGLGVEGRQYTGDGDFRSGMFTLRFSLPWGNAGKYRKEYEREKERQKAAEEEREDQTLTVREELHHLTVEIEARGREALLHRDEITTRAQQALSSRLADWETGRGTFRDVLDARRMLLESQLLSARAVAEQRQAIAELLLWSGLETAESLTPLTTEPSITPEHEH
jgi:outer membrane protein TolC